MTETNYLTKTQLATALDMGAAALVTHDRDFSAVQGLPILYGS